MDHDRYLHASLSTECLYPEEVTKVLGRLHCSTNTTTTGSQYLVMPIALLQSTEKYFDCDSSGNHQNSPTRLQGSLVAHVNRRWLTVNCCGVCSIYSIKYLQQHASPLFKCTVGICFVSSGWKQSSAWVASFKCCLDLLPSVPASWQQCSLLVASSDSKRKT